MRRTFLVIIILLASTARCFSQEPESLSSQFQSEWKKAKLDYAEGRYEEAFEFFYIASASGINEASYVVGLMYEEGKAVPRDYEKAFKYYSCTAEAGIFGGQLGLSLTRFEGKFSEKNYKEAYKWILLAQSNNDVSKEKKESIEKFILLIEKRLNREEIRDVQQRLKSWKPKEKPCHINE